MTGIITYIRKRTNFGRMTTCVAGSSNTGRLVSNKIQQKRYNIWEYLNYEMMRP